MRHVFVDQNTFDEGSVGQRSSDLSVDFDQVEGYISSFQISYCKDGVNGNLGELSVLFRDARAVKRRVSLLR